MKNIEESLNTGMILGFSFGGFYMIGRTIFEIIVATREYGWDGISFYFGVIGIIPGILMLGLAGKWLEEHENDSKETSSALE